MKKCPECGNPSYDGAPVCGNCGFKFPKPKVAAPKEESIFEKATEEKKPSSNESTLNIIKDNKLIIGAILLITLIVILGIVLTGLNNNKSISPVQNTDEFNQGDFSFKYPNSWESLNETDMDHQGAIFFKNGNNTSIEYYNSTMDSSTLKNIAQDRIRSALDDGSYVAHVETININGNDASNIIIENADGNFTRFVSMLKEGELYVFKINGDSYNSVTAEDMTSVINSAKIS